MSESSETASERLINRSPKPASENRGRRRIFFFFGKKNSRLWRRIFSSPRGTARVSREEGPGRITHIRKSPKTSPNLESWPAILIHGFPCVSAGEWSNFEDHQENPFRVLNKSPRLEWFQPARRLSRNTGGYRGPRRG